jgi:hypothetical protein
MQLDDIILKIYTPLVIFIGWTLDWTK